jgi:hypothetical protein
MDKVRYRAGYKYQLVENVSTAISIYPLEEIETDYILLNRLGLLTIKKGYAWDGPSGPTIDTKTFMRGSLVHDALYQLIRMGKLNSEHRKEADKILRKICLEDGMCKARAWWVYRAVRRCGWTAIDPKKELNIKEAP